MNVLLRALAFAADKHRNQRRKDAEASPYINHPIALADVLANEGHVTDETMLVAAILHDTIEDTETTADELRRHFGETVTAIVLGRVHSRFMGATISVRDATPRCARTGIVP